MPAVRAKGPDGNVILGRVGDRSGPLRVVDSAAACGSRETAISFNREGEQGKTGKAGARGKAGDDGGGDSLWVTGTVALTAADFPPPSTMFAAGQTLSIPANAALYSLLQTTYGGNGTTNFRVPNLRQQAPGTTNSTMCVAGEDPSRD